MLINLKTNFIKIKIFILKKILIFISNLKNYDLFCKNKLDFLFKNLTKIYINQKRLLKIHLVVLEKKNKEDKAKYLEEIEYLKRGLPKSLHNSTLHLFMNHYAFLPFSMVIVFIVSFFLAALEYYTGIKIFFFMDSVLLFIKKIFLFIKKIILYISKYFS